MALLGPELDPSGLKGQLEDLPLVDIVQIVNFTRRTGYLEVECTSGKAAIAFQKGFVRGAYTGSTRARIEGICAAGGDHRETRLAALVHESLRELLTLREGAFQLQLGEALAPLLAGVDIHQWLLEKAINPERLMLETASRLQEAPRSPSPLAAAPPERNEPAPPPCAVVLVDDEPEVLNVVGRALRAAGFSVAVAPGSFEGASIAQRLSRTGRVIVVTDLKMPTSSGVGFNGGFELVRMLKLREVKVPVVVVTETSTPKLTLQANQMGVKLVPSKPYLSKLDAPLYRADLVAFAGSLVRLVTELLGAGDALSEAGPAHAAAAAGEDLVDFLTAMTEQMVNPRRSVDVSRLVLRVAARHVDRGVLFLVKETTACGLAGFGMTPQLPDGAAPLSKVVIEIAEAPAFAQVMRAKTAQRFETKLDLLLAPLYAAIGRGVSQECVIVPLLNRRNVLAFLFADNGSSGRPLGELRGLELFVTQAGLAIENLHLHQRLAHSKVSHGGAAVPGR